MARLNTEVDEPDHPPPPKPKRSLFQKSAWAAPVEDAKPVELFSRAKELFPEVVRENERRLRKLERRRSSASIEAAEGSKKRRISDDPDESEDQEQDKDETNKAVDLGGSSDDEEVVAEYLKQHSAAPSTPRSRRKKSISRTPIKKSPRNAVKTSPHKRSSKSREEAAAPVISLSDDEDEDAALNKELDDALAPIPLDSDREDDDLTILKELKAESTAPAEVHNSEDHYAEFVARAREKAMQKKLQIQNALAAARTRSTASPASDGGLLRSPELTRGPKPPSPAQDPVVQILVDSAMEGTKPLILKRLLSQRLKDVRIAWCDHQSTDGKPMDEALKSQIFLTWRGKKVFDVTSCQSMGLKLNAAGKIVMPGDGSDTNGRIYLQAWTDDAFEAYKKQKAEERKRNERHLMTAEERENEVEEVQPVTQVEKYKIVLKSKDFKELKLRVPPGEKIFRLLHIFRTQHNITDQRTITFHLDGDQLDPEIPIEEWDIDIDDITTIDVHVGSPSEAE
jgi:hypothetical protein